MVKVSFGRLLTEGIYSVAYRWKKGVTAIEEEIGESLGYSSDTVHRWRRGHLPRNPEIVEFIVRYCVKNGRLDQNWAYSILTQAQHPSPESFLRELFPISTTTVKLMNNLPAPPIYFVGRAKELERVSEGLSLQSRWPIVSIEGIGGIGKTTLALQSAYQILFKGEDANFKGLIWITVNEKSDLDAILETILKTLSYQHTTQLTHETKVGEVIRLLSSQPILLILDNLETLADSQILNFLEMLPAPTKALVTSRSQFRGTWTIRLQGLSNEEAVKLIQYNAKRLDLSEVIFADPNALKQLIALTFGHPLAIQFAIGQLALDLSLNTVITSLSKGSSTELFEEIYWNAWNLLTEDTKKLAITISIFEDPVTKSNLHSASGMIEAHFDAALAQLLAISLIDEISTPKEDGFQLFYTIHPLTRTFIRSYALSIDESFDREAVVKAKFWIDQLDTTLSKIKANTNFSSQAKSLFDLLRERVGFQEILKTSSIVHQGFHIFLADFSSLFSGINFPAILPLIFCSLETLYNGTLEEFRQLLIQQLGASVRTVVIVAPFESTSLNRYERIVVDRMRNVYAYNIICLTRSELKKIIGAQDPQHILRQLILAQVNLETVAPFVVTGPASDTIFFGREAEMRTITEQGATTNYALIGGRRIGKTSILKRLERVRLPAAGFNAFYHDCSYTSNQTELIRAVSTDKTWFYEPPTNLPSSFLEVIQALPDDKPLVILLDETDKLIKPDQRAGYPLFNTLRAMANEGRCRFVLSGEQVLRLELTNPDSPLYNFANEMLIRCLDCRAMEELFTQPMKQLEIMLIDETEMVQRIWDFTSGHPNIVQRLCQRLVAQLNQRHSRSLMFDDVDEVIVDPDFLRKDFLNVYWERATVLERLCSLMMAADENVRTLKAMYKTLNNRYLSVTLNQVDDAMERLVDLRNILRRTPDGYEFLVNAFPEVIAKTSRLEDLIAINCETYQQHGDVVSHTKGGI
ncbi:MAG: hypothetical protein KJ077_24805 [Anaerolineae bacterium]|nr:hypothetical protein [Anaerolineae bacterium]